MAVEHSVIGSLGVEVDDRGFNEYDRRIRREEARGPVKTKAGLEVERTGFADYERKVASARRESDRMGGSMRMLATAGGVLGQSFSSLGLPAAATGMALLTQGISATAAGAVALTASLAPLAGGIAGLTNMALAGGQGFGVLALAGMGVGKALKEATGQTTTNASALKAQQSAADQTRTANERLADAHRAETTAQQQLSQARRQAAMDIENLRLKVEQLDTAEQRGKLNVDQAKQNLKEVKANPYASREELASARLDVKEAEDSLTQTRVDSHRAHQDLSTAESKGVNGSDQVVKARQQVASAQRDVRDATRDVAKAHREAGDAAKQSNQELKKLPPAAQEFVRELVKMQPLLDKLRATAAAGLFPGVIDGLHSLTHNFGPVNQVVGETAHALGDLAAEAGKQFGSASWGADLKRLGDANVTVIRDLGHGALDFADALKDVLVSAIPFTKWMAQTGEGWGRYLKNAAAAGRETGKLGTFFDHTKQTMTSLGHILAGVASGLFGVGKAAQPFGGDILHGIEKAAQAFGKWANSAKGQKDIKGWFDSSEKFFKAFGPDFAHNLGVIVGLIAKLSGGLTKFLEHHDQLRSMATAVLAFASAWKLISFGGKLTGLSALVKGAGTATKALYALSTAKKAAAGAEAVADVAGGASSVGGLGKVVGRAPGTSRVSRVLSTVGIGVGSGAPKLASETEKAASGGSKLLGSFTKMAPVVGRILPMVMRFAGPIGLAGTAAYELYKHWDQVKAGAGKAWDAIKSGASAAVKGIGSAGSSLVHKLGGVWDSVKGGASKLWGAVKSGAGKAFDAAKSAASKGLLGPLPLIASHWKGIWGNVKKWGTGALDGIVGAAKAMPGKIGDGLKSLGSVLAKPFTAAWDSIKAGWSKLPSPIRQAASGVWNGAKSVAGSVWDHTIGGLFADGGRVPGGRPQLRHTRGGTPYVVGDGSKAEWDIALPNGDHRVVSQEGDRKKNIGYAMEALRALGVPALSRGGVVKDKSSVDQLAKQVTAADNSYQNKQRTYQRTGGEVDAGEYAALQRMQAKKLSLMRREGDALKNFIGDLKHERDDTKKQLRRHLPQAEADKKKNWLDQYEQWLGQYGDTYSQLKVDLGSAKQDAADLADSHRQQAATELTITPYDDQLKTLALRLTDAQVRTPDDPSDDDAVQSQITAVTQKKYDLLHQRYNLAAATGNKTAADALYDALTSTGSELAGYLGNDRTIPYSDQLRAYSDSRYETLTQYAGNAAARFMPQTAQQGAVQSAGVPQVMLGDGAILYGPQYKEPYRDPFLEAKNARQFKHELTA